MEGAKVMIRMTLICSRAAKHLSFGNIYVLCFSKRLENRWLKFARMKFCSQMKGRMRTRGRRLEWMHFGSRRYFAVLETTAFVFVFVSETRLSSMLAQFALINPYGFNQLTACPRPTMLSRSRYGKQEIGS